MVISLHIMIIGHVSIMGNFHSIKLIWKGHFNYKLGSRGRGKTAPKKNDSGYQSGGSFNQFQPSASTLDPSQDQASCQCGVPAIVLTVRKDGPNQGRDFYKCESGNCNYFSWTDEMIAPSFTSPANSGTKF